MMKVNKYAQIALSALLLMGCPQTHVQDDVVPDSSSGGDESLSGARGVFDDVVADSVNAQEGDNTDVKYFDIDGPGAFDLRVRFHEPVVSGTVALLNEYGDMLREISYTSGGEVTFEAFDAFPGRYYVRIRADEGRSDYSIGREFHPDPSWLSADDAQWVDNQLARVEAFAADGRFADARAALDLIQSRFPTNTVVAGRLVASSAAVDSAEEEYWLSRVDDDDDRDEDDDDRDTDGDGDDDDGVRDSDGDADGDSHDDDGDDDGDGDNDGADEAGTHGVEARIITLRDRGAGLGTMLVLTGCGSSSGLDIGSEGQIEGTRYTATITQITGSDACYAESDRARGEVGSAGSVIF